MLFYHIPHWMEEKAAKQVERKENKRKALRSYLNNNPDFIPTLQENATAYGFMPTDTIVGACLLYTSPSPRDRTRSRMPSSA